MDLNYNYDYFSGTITDAEVPILQMSTISDEGVQEVKIEACERLLSFRVDIKMRTKKVLFLYLDVC